MQGDLPPSSSVTGVRFWAAASMTCRADRRRAGIEQMVEGQGGEGGAGLRSAKDGRHFVGGKQLGQEVAMNSDVRGVSSDGLSITRLPAASAAISGTMARLNG